METSKQREPPRPAEVPSDRADVRAISSPIRCPYCHDGVEQAKYDWVACKACLARHHHACWNEARKCGTCGGEEFLLATLAQKAVSPGLAWTAIGAIIAIVAAVAAIVFAT